MRLLCWLITIIFSVFLIGCSSPDSENNNTEDEEESQLEIDKGLLNVEVTLPAAFFEEEDIDSVIADAKENGVKEVTKNEDGSLTYKMSKATHQDLMNEMEADINKSIEEMTNSGDYPSIKAISSENNSFSEFTVEVIREEFENSFDGFALLGLGIYGGYYQIFNGTKADDYQVVIHLKDQDTGEVFDEVTYPDDLDTDEGEAPVKE